MSMREGESSRSTSYQLQRFDALDVDRHDRFQVYQAEVFGPVEAEFPIRQDLDRDEMEAILASPHNYALLLVDTENDEIQGHAVLAWDLSTLGWVSEAFFAANYPVHADQRRICMIAGIGVRNGTRSLALLRAIVDRVVLDVETRRALAVADIRGAGSPQALSRYMIARMRIAQGAEYTAETIARQEYMLYRPTIRIGDEETSEQAALQSER